MSKLTDNLSLSDLGNSRHRGAKTLQVAIQIKDKSVLTPEDIDILIEAGYFKETGIFKSADEIIKSRLEEIFSVMGFAAESSARWRSIMEDETARLEFVKTYRKGSAGLVQRQLASDN